MAPIAFGGSSGEERLKVWVAHGQKEIRATSGSYHCIPPEEPGGPSTCIDRGPELPLNGRLRLHSCDKVTIRTGYPARLVRARVENSRQKVLARLGFAKRINDERTLFELKVRPLPANSDRFHLFVTHTDDNAGDFEAGIKRRPSRCGRG